MWKVLKLTMRSYELQHFISFSSKFDTAAVNLAAH